MMVPESENVASGAWPIAMSASYDPVAPAKRPVLMPAGQPA